MRASLVRQESLNTSKGLATFRSNTATICAPLWLRHRPLPSSASLHIRRGRGHTGQSLWYGASKFFYFLFFQQSWRGESCTFLAWCCITWSDATLPSSWTYGIVPFINIKSRQGRIYWSQGLMMGPFIMSQLHKSHYGAMESQDPVLWYEPHQIWDLSCMMKTQSRLHIAQISSLDVPSMKNLLYDLSNQ